jgi:7,8-dihydro-6-hydroxymethylpterin-pyrophosphokinase
MRGAETNPSISQSINPSISQSLSASRSLCFPLREPTLCRRFALLPLHEIATALRHPQLNKTINELLETCPDTGQAGLMNYEL